MTCRILTVNILAENFIFPQYYPGDCDKYLSTEYRLNKLKNFLLLIRNYYDILVLQEVTHDTIINGSMHNGNYNIIQQVMYDFHGMFVAHDVDHWLTDSSSYLQNGNATFVRKSLAPVSFYDLNLTTGNHCLLAQFANYRIINIHLDSDDSDKRQVEFSQILRYLLPTDTIDIIAGDFNMVLDNKMIAATNFRVVSPITIPTFAFGEIMAGDMILCRNGYCSNSTNLGQELLQQRLSNHCRLINCLKLWGTDHIPVTATINKLIIH